MIILASQSKHRAALLEKLGVPFTVQPAHVDETPRKNETPLAYVKRIAMAKAQAISTTHPGTVVLAADTPVVLGRRILQTPTTSEEATAMLTLCGGRRITVHTVVVVADITGRLHTKTSSSWVKLKRLTKEDIASYINKGIWQHSAGGIKIEHMEPWILTLHGSVSGIKGLPLYETATLLARAGVKVDPFK